MTYVKTYLPTLKTHVVNLKRDAKDLSRDLQRLEARGKLGSKTLYYGSTNVWMPRVKNKSFGWAANRNQQQHRLKFAVTITQ